MTENLTRIKISNPEDAVYGDKIYVTGVEIRDDWDIVTICCSRRGVEYGVKSLKDRLDHDQLLHGMVNLLNEFNEIDIRVVCKNREKWRDLCGKIIIYYASRYITTGRPPPVLKFEGNQREQLFPDDETILWDE